MACIRLALPSWFQPPAAAIGLAVVYASLSVVFFVVGLEGVEQVVLYSIPTVFDALPLMLAGQLRMLTSAESARAGCVHVYVRVRGRV